MTQEEILQQVYLILGNPSTELLPEEIVNHYIDQWEVIYPIGEEDCMLIYKTVISCVGYIISKLTSEGEVSGREIKEKEGLVEIELKNKDKSPIDGWKDWLDYFLKNASEFLPCLLNDENFSNTAMPIVTGLQRDQYEKVLKNTNNISNGYRIGSVWEQSYNQNLDSAIRGNSYSTTKRRK